jgi:hypothetical protein
VRLSSLVNINLITQKLVTTGGQSSIQTHNQYHYAVVLGAVALGDGMEDQICNWTPELVVDLVKAVIWPVTVLIIGIRFRSGIYGSLQKFLSKNTVSEVSATTSGVSAKFVAAKQTSETIESAGTNAINLPEKMNADAIQKRHEEQQTEFSEELYSSIKSHLSALHLTKDEEVELIAKEASLLQSAIRYFDINKVLFRSQYNLFSIMANNAGFIDKNGAQNNFISVKEKVGEGLSDWDWIKYVSYPVSNGIIVENESGYELTCLGKSYVSFMSRNPQLIDDLAKL